jgi:hypothetical protein
MTTFSDMLYHLGGAAVGDGLMGLGLGDGTITAGGNSAIMQVTNTT